MDSFQGEPGLEFPYKIGINLYINVYNLCKFLIKCRASLPVEHNEINKLSVLTGS